MPDIEVFPQNPSEVDHWAVLFDLGAPEPFLVKLGGVSELDHLVAYSHIRKHVVELGSSIHLHLLASPGAVVPVWDWLDAWCFAVEAVEDGGFLDDSGPVVFPGWEFCYVLPPIPEPVKRSEVTKLPDDQKATARVSPEVENAFPSTRAHTAEYPSPLRGLLAGRSASLLRDGIRAIYLLILRGFYRGVNFY